MKNGGKGMKSKMFFRAVQSLFLSALFLLLALPGSAPAASKLKVALCLPGAVSDKGFNASAHVGLMIAKERMGAEVAFSENVQRPDFVSTLRDYANRGYDVIISHGFQWGDAMSKVAKQFPKKHFINTYGFGKAPNLANLHVAHQELFHVMGQLAVKMSKKGNVGAVGGWEIPPIRIQVDAFEKGVRKAKPNATVNVIWTGTFYDPVKGKEAAKALISQGADIVAHLADASGLGVIEAAREKNVLTMGYFADQRKLAPKHVVSSAVIKTGEMLYKSVKAVTEGNFKSGINMFGLKSGVLEVGPYGPMVPQKVKDDISTLVKKIKSGEINIPAPNLKKLMKQKIKKI
jgi:basic membrane protein A